MTWRAGLSILATLAVLIGSLFYLMSGVLNMRTFADQTTVTITAPKTNGLHQGSAVVYRGVPIGEVRSVGYRGGDEVSIEIAYDAAFAIPVDSELIIENQSMLGETALYFAPRTADGPTIRSGQRFAARIVEVPASVPELLGSAQTLLDQVDPGLVNELVETLSIALAGTEGDIERITPSAQLVAATMIYAEPSLVKIMQNASTMMSDGAWIGPSLRPTKAELVIAGENLAEVITHVKPFADFTDGGRIIGERWKPALEGAAEMVGDLVPSIAALAETLTPAAQASGRSLLGTLNIATLLEQAMRALPGDAVRLTVTVP